MKSLGLKSKYNKTDDAALLQYPHQTASGRREIRAASDQSVTRPTSRLQEPRNPERAAIAYGGTEPTLHDSQLTSPSASPHKPAVQDFQEKHQPSQTSSSRPLSPSNASEPLYHASSSPPKEQGFAVADAEAGRNSKTWTRNRIRIPPRTRYAMLCSDLSMAN